MFASVPRLFSRIVDGIYSKVGIAGDVDAKVRKAGGVKEKLFNRGVEAKVGEDAGCHR